MATPLRTAHKLARWVIGTLSGTGLSQDEADTATDNTGYVSPLLSATCRRAAAEGCVLLENDATLPLSTSDEVAVFGRCQLDWFCMGRGSGGDVRSPYRTNLMDGLREMGARHNQVLAEVYRAWCADDKNAADKGFWGHWPTHHLEMPVSAELAQAAASTARTAIVVLGRNAGEDLDLPLTRGGYYLTTEEQNLLARVTQAFEKTVVIVNSSNVIDMAWREAYGPRISALLLANQGGMEAGSAVASVLYGETCPSGRLTSTIARSWEDYPSSRTFGRSRHVDYTEGIFVGYRHFDAHAPQNVLYPFGHGLSYTSFQVLPFALEREGGKVVSRVFVENAGNAAGREVVLLWCHPAQGALEKPTRVLAAFAKTRELQPGEAEELSLSFDLRTVASFDESQRAFVLEGGTYELAANQEPAGSFSLATTLVIERCEHFCATSAELHDRILERMPTEIVPTGDKDIMLEDVAQGNATLEAFVAQLSDNELARLTCGEGTMNSPLGQAGNAGAFGGVTKGLRARGIPAAICADGPSGVRLAAQASLIPSATTLACTWDTQLVERVYHLLGKEAADNGIDVLLAPGMNIQRNPRCGRNFEYYSEDPLLTGRMATAVVRGLSSAGVSACPKHYAANNQERARNSYDARVCERALREIYLRGFEMCVREARPDLIMTSYNRVNGVYAHYHYDLATTILRGEWGFAGLVITDWWMRRAHSPEFPALRDNAYRVRAGVDVLMPGNLLRVPWGRHRDRSALAASRAELQQSAYRVLRFLLPLTFRARPQEVTAQTKNATSR